MEKEAHCFGIISFLFCQLQFVIRGTCFTCKKIKNIEVDDKKKKKVLPVVTWQSHTIDISIGPIPQETVTWTAPLWYQQ